MQTIGIQKDSAAWIIQTWVAFVISISMTTFDIVNLPVNAWVKGFIDMSMLSLLAQLYFCKNY